MCTHYISNGVLYPIAISKVLPSSPSDSKVSKGTTAFAGQVSLKRLQKDLDLFVPLAGPSRSTGPKRAAQGKSSMIFNSKDVDPYCLYVHELNHLCIFQDKPCVDERSAFVEQVKCLKSYVGNCDVIDDQNRNDCQSLCWKILEHDAYSRFANCFCGSAGSTNGFQRCCDCVRSCGETPVLNQCKGFINPQTGPGPAWYCDVKVTGSVSHSCAYYAQWKPPWNNAVVNCAAYPPEAR